MINIIIPAYNAHLTIERAIMSIVSQTVKDLISIIIVNDGSKRDYSFLVKKYSPEIKIKEIKNELNLGVGITRQKGIDEVDQPYFAFMDSDDNYINNKIVEKALSVFEKQKEIVLISCNFIEENK
jgi:teichuronic acid biosynthesis glycosyltransferase TuaG